MKLLRTILDRVKPSFRKGARFGFLHSTFEAFDSFAFVSNATTRSGAHIRDCNDLKRVMTVVIIALLPALCFGCWNVGYQHALAFGHETTFWSLFGYGFLRVLPILLTSYIVGLGVEFVAAQLRGHEVNEGFLVTGLLIPLIMPVNIPLWMVGLATAFAVIIGKEIFGGTGMNIFNPALLARAFIFFSYPSQISGDQAWVAGLPSPSAIDAASGATPLAEAAAGHVDALPSLADLFFGFIPGSIGETSTLAILIGAVILIYTGVASWKIMLSCVVGLLATGYVLHWIGGAPYLSLPPYCHLLMGGFAFGAVFMATDPVTAAQTETGKWLYGFLIGALTILIRVFNEGYPEGMMLAILLMNAFAPLIDHYVVAAHIRRRLKRARTISNPVSLKS
ncbi:MAG: NADH:ubiquinone reductase (Na(+)-transporting) subunit B [Prevotellaceae bacterium]|jgi:Na+-transporting NADH:ubiquinone oxidoreductase subunit B|nr:NADH:ubiquinone reductase (Na(+)-transporting) subunit B [Prevotellaceae bacterium]